MKLLAGLVMFFIANSITAQVDTIITKLADSTITQVVDTSINAIGNPEKMNTVSFNQLTEFDKIKLETGDSLIVNIIAETQTEVAFKYPLNTMINKASYTKVKEIIYKNGKTRAFRNLAPVSGVGAEADNLWRIVVITYEESDVAGLKEIGPISAKAEGKSLKTNIDLLEKNVTVNLKKNAVRMNATKVLVKKRKIEQSYGEIPLVELTGVAYGAE